MAKVPEESFMRSMCDGPLSGGQQAGHFPLFEPAFSPSQQAHIILVRPGKMCATSRSPANCEGEGKSGMLFFASRDLEVTDGYMKNGRRSESVIYAHLGNGEGGGGGTEQIPTSFKDMIPLDS